MELRLYQEEDEFLLPRDVVSRLVQSIPKILVNWDRGDHLVEDKLQELIAMDAPNPVITGHKSLFGQTAYVEI